MESLNHGMYLSLNYQTLKHLSIANLNHDEYGTLYQLLSKNNLTSFGKRLMYQWCIKPLFNWRSIKMRQNSVQFLVGLMTDDLANNDAWFSPFLRSLSLTKVMLL